MTKPKTPTTALIETVRDALDWSTVEAYNKAIVALGALTTFEQRMAEMEAKAQGLVEALKTYSCADENGKCWADAVSGQIQ